MLAGKGVAIFFFAALGLRVPRVFVVFAVDNLACDFKPVRRDAPLCPGLNRGPRPDA